jgi:uncharacterized protein (TIGR03790 family)
MALDYVGMNRSGAQVAKNGVGFDFPGRSRHADRRMKIEAEPMKSNLTLFSLALCLAVVLPLPARALDRTQLAVIVNTLDPLSVRIGDYYAARRKISFQNFIRVSFPPLRTVLTRDEFDAIKAQVDRQTLPNVQAYALTWAAPYRVECMSITTAFAFGFDRAFCAEGCKPTRPSPYFDSPALLPFTQLKIRPTMSIAAESFEQAKALIDRGVESDGSFPTGTAYLLSTSDKARNVRSAWYPMVEQMFKSRLHVRQLREDALRDKKDVLFYFTGAAQVGGLDTLRFVPGAVADHLTSTGGKLTDSSQMSALRWLEAGATGSYGTVVEPCDMLQKFPHPGVVIGHYFAGETLIEAYWKSVDMPGQGIFVGEPLAAPFRRSATR